MSMHIRNNKSLVRMNFVGNTRRELGITIFVSLLLFVLIGNNLHAQCVITTPPSQQGCSGSVTFNAGSFSSSVNHHVWYDQFFNALSPTTERAIVDSGGNQTVWVSTLTVPVSGNATYYVAASCDTNDKRAVTFTSQNGIPIGITMNPASSNPLDLCVGESITLTGRDSRYQIGLQL